MKRSNLLLASLAVLLVCVSASFFIANNSSFLGGNAVGTSKKIDGVMQGEGLSDESRAGEIAYHEGMAKEVSEDLRHKLTKVVLALMNMATQHVDHKEPWFRPEELGFAGRIFWNELCTEPLNEISDFGEHCDLETPLRPVLIPREDILKDLDKHGQVIFLVGDFLRGVKAAHATGKFPTTDNTSFQSLKLVKDLCGDGMRQSPFDEFRLKCQLFRPKRRSR